MNHHTPILFISGAMDMVGDCSKGVERAAAAFQRAGMRDVTVKLYPELRHEVLKEDCREQVYDDIDRWLEGKLAGDPLRRFPFCFTNRTAFRSPAFFIFLLTISIFDSML